MAFNGAGTFVRLYSWAADAVDGIKISSSRMDSEMDGMATGMSNCITKNGETVASAMIPFAAGVSVSDGAAATPSITFTGDLDNGFYRIGADNWAVAVAGTKLVEFKSGIVGIGMVPVNVLDITQTQDAVSRLKILNASTGNSAAAQLNAVISGAGTGAVAECRLDNGTAVAEFLLYGAGFTTSGVARQNGLHIYNNGAGGITVNTGAAQPIYFGINSVEAARFDVGGELLIGTTTDNGAFLLQVNSQIFATNATIATSDATLKKELPALSLDVVEKIMAVPTRFYERIDRPQDGSRAGYFAQDWEAIFGLETGIVKRPPNGKLQLDENAVQALKIMALEQAILGLEARLAKLEAKP